jgi:hypothetical protein
MNTFHSISKTKRETYAKHRIIQTVDLIEDTGADPIELQIQMHFHAPYTLAPARAMTALEAVMDLRVPLPLIIGSTPIGRGFLTLFVIEDIATKMSRFISSSLIVADIDVKLLEYPSAFNLAGPLSALGGALPGVSSAVATITSTISSLATVSGIASSVNGMLGQFGVKALVGGTVGGVISTLAGAGGANAITSTISSLMPGQVTQITAPSQEMVMTAIDNLKASGH